MDDRLYCDSKDWLLSPKHALNRIRVVVGIYIVAVGIDDPVVVVDVVGIVDDAVVVADVGVCIHLLWSLGRPFSDPLRLRCRTLSRVRHGGNSLSPTDCYVYFLV